MKKPNELAEGGLTLKIRELHIHMDERTEIKNEYSYPQPEEAKCCCDDCGCDEDDDEEDEDSCEPFTDEDVIKAVSGKTGFSEETIRMILDSQAEMLVKHLLGDIIKPHTTGKKAGAL